MNALDTADIYKPESDILDIEKVVIYLWQKRLDNDAVSAIVERISHCITEKQIFMDIEYFLPQILHMIIHIDFDYSDNALEQLAIMTSLTSAHAALQIVFALLAAMEDNQPELSNGQKNPVANHRRFFRCAHLLQNVERAVVYNGEGFLDLVNIGESKDPADGSPSLSASELVGRRMHEISKAFAFSRPVMMDGPRTGELLYKRTHRKSATSTKPWKQQFFVIDQKVLLCYHDRYSPRSKRSIFLESCEVVEGNHAKYGRTYFEIVDRNTGTIFQLRAEDERERAEWVRLLRSEIEGEPQPIDRMRTTSGYLNPKAEGGTTREDAIHNNSPNSLTEAQHARFVHFREERLFIDSLTGMCESLRFRAPGERKFYLRRDLAEVPVPRFAYLSICCSIDSYRSILCTLPLECHAFSTKARCPALMLFEVEEHPHRVDVATFLNKDLPYFGVGKAASSKHFAPHPSVSSPRVVTFEKGTAGGGGGAGTGAGAGVGSSSRGGSADVAESRHGRPAAGLVPGSSAFHNRHAYRSVSMDGGGDGAAEGNGVRVDEIEASFSADGADLESKTGQIAGAPKTGSPLMSIFNVFWGSAASTTATAGGSDGAEGERSSIASRRGSSAKSDGTGRIGVAMPGGGNSREEGVGEGEEEGGDLDYVDGADEFLFRMNENGRIGVGSTVVTDEEEQENVEASQMATVFGEPFASRIERLRAASEYGHLPGWGVDGLIAKSNDDLRQEVFVMQLISYYQRVFQLARVPVWLHTYKIQSTSQSTGLIELITDSVSLDGLKKKEDFPGNLRLYYERTYGYKEGQPEPPAFRTAINNYIASMAGYSIVTYLLGIKDRHNGNVMIDRSGHVIHIDFGFVFGLAPGKAFSLEKAPWKLTSEMAEVMGGRNSLDFTDYTNRCVHALLEARRHCESICALMEIMVYCSNYPAFRYNANAIRDFRARNFLGKTDKEVAAIVRSYMNKSYNHSGTNLYDKFQLATNGIAV